MEILVKSNYICRNFSEISKIISLFAKILEVRTNCVAGGDKIVLEAF